MSAAQHLGELFDQIGFGRTDRPDGTVVWDLPVAPHVVNSSGGLQGGFIATLVDIAAGTAVLESGTSTRIATSDLNLRYLRAVKSGKAEATARIVHSGRRSIVVQVDVTELPAGDLAAIATVSFAHVGEKAAEATTEVHSTSVH